MNVKSTPPLMQSLKKMLKEKCIKGRLSVLIDFEIILKIKQNINEIILNYSYYCRSKEVTQLCINRISGYHLPYQRV